jgi:hypothetical protein
MKEVSWYDLKNFIVTNYALPLQVSHAELSDRYSVWVEWRGLRLETHNIYKDSTEAEDFVTNIKPISNLPQSNLSRVTTNKFGRRLHDRYISITTAAETNKYDNTDYKDVDYGDITYVLKDINGETTLVGAEAKETHIIFEPTFDYEIFLGEVYIPSELPGNNDNAWECHAVAVPDVTANLGGCIQLIANPRLKWSKGGKIGKSVFNPAELKYSVTLHTNKILIIFKHPVGSQCEFQINLALFK